MSSSLVYSLNFLALPGFVKKTVPLAWFCFVWMQIITYSKLVSLKLNVAGKKHRIVTIVSTRLLILLVNLTFPWEITFPPLLDDSFLPPLCSGIQHLILHLKNCFTFFFLTNKVETIREYPHPFIPHYLGTINCFQALVLCFLQWQKTVGSLP